MTSTVTVPEFATRALEPTAFHYFKKSAITRSLVLGTKETAICGYNVPIGAAADGASSSRAKPSVCPLCQSLYNLLGGPK